MDIEDIRVAFNLEGYKLLTKEYKNQNTKLEYICPNDHERHTTWKNWKRGNRCLICKNQSTKLNIEEIKNSFVKEGYILLSKEYVNNKTKLDYSCPEGHKNSITWADWNSGGYRCPDCAGNKKLFIDKIIEDFVKESYTFLSGDYINNTSELNIRCPAGHEFVTSRVKWTSGNRCPECYSNRINIDVVRESFEKEGYVLLSKEYTDAHTKLRFICVNGHEHEISWSAWNQGQRCFYCRNDTNRVPIADIKTMFMVEGYSFIESSYHSDKLEYICSEGHKGSITLGNWKLGNRCPHCYGNVKLKFDFVKEQIELENYEVLSSSEEFINNRTKLHLICPNGHDYYASWFDWNSNKVRCYKCKEKGTSLQEQEILDFVKSLCSDTEVHDRYLISPYELDIVIPSKKIAIEYCGLYWHSELVGKDRNYHLNKLKMCESIGYRLITIFEDELLYKKEIVFSVLKHLLNCNESKKVYARVCNIKEVDATEARIFCESNHLQGYTGSNIKLGAFYNNNLIALMTFAKPSLSKGNGTFKEGVWELSRFCIDNNYRVVGIASKLLKYFKLNYEWNSLFSYADMRWSSGNVYDKIGFDLEGVTKPNYWYFKSSNNIRKHRFALRKQPDEPKDKTEWELRQEQGWNRIWDCGNKKYVTYNK